MFVFYKKGRELMSQQVETEFKNLLTKEEYEMLIIDFNLEDTEPVQQTNVYYDSPDWKLRKLGMGLRIRLYDNYAEQTLKSPISEHKMLETTDRLTHEEGQNFVDSGELKRDGFIAKKLAEH
ncbi:CYTH domain-containing protein, partial [Jeotgalibaca porci]